MKDQEQKQSQEITVVSSEQHGIISEVHCPYYTDERSEFFEQNKDSGPSGTEAINNKELYYKSQQVQYLIYKGEIKKVFCVHLKDNGNCNSSSHKDSKCIIKG